MRAGGAAGVQRLGVGPVGERERAHRDRPEEKLRDGREEARKEAILRLKGFNVVGSMENPPTTSAAIQAKRSHG